MKIDISLDISKVEHLADKSDYNYNYYRLFRKGMDCAFYNEFNILLEYCDEDEGYFEYTLGRFDGDNFIEALSWTHYGFDSILDSILED